MKKSNLYADVCYTALKDERETKNKGLSLQELGDVILEKHPNATNWIECVKKLPALFPENIQEKNGIYTWNFLICTFGDIIIGGGRFKNKEIKNKSK